MLNALCFAPLAVAAKDETPEAKSGTYVDWSL